MRVYILWQPHNMKSQRNVDTLASAKLETEGIVRRVWDVCNIEAVSAGTGVMLFGG
jgi:hypothetical protein